MTTTSYDPFDPEAWSGTPGCEAFEIALDMRAQGALAPTAVPVLEAHLGSCESCREHAAGQARVAAALSASTPAAPNWEAVHARMQASAKRLYRVVVAIAGSLLGGLGVAWVSNCLFGAPALRLSVAAVVAGSAFGLLGLAYWERRRRLRVLLERRDIVAIYRGELEASIRRLERALLTRRVAIVVVAGQLVFQIASAHGHMPEDRGSMVMKVLMLVTLLLTRVFYPRRVRALRRQLAELQ